MQTIDKPADPYGCTWWDHEALLRRFVSDFVYSELCLMRRGSAGIPPLPWLDTLELEANLGVDSLEKYALATAFASCLHLAPSCADELLLHCATLGQWIGFAKAGLIRASAELSFKTSGSSGVPKSCAQRVDMLWQEACFFAALLPQARRIVYTVPAHHIYGFLFTVLLPLACSPRRAELVDARRMLPAELLQQTMFGDVVIGYPELWSSVAKEGCSWPAGVTGVTSTATCPKLVASQLCDSGLYLLEVYGSSESAGVGWRADPNEPYTLLPYWQRDAAGHTLTRLAPDEVSYQCEFQDHIDWYGETCFLPVGRRDQAVQVGGINVFPLQVAALLKQHPGVIDAHVRMMRADEGQRLKAFVVARKLNDISALPGQLTLWVREHLPPAARPVSFTVGAELPTNRQGKLVDWIIPDSPDFGEP